MCCGGEAGVPWMWAKGWKFHSVYGNEVNVQLLEGLFLGYSIRYASFVERLFLYYCNVASQREAIVHKTGRS